jgi:peptide/nickel transport system substrate-binding protein
MPFSRRLFLTGATAGLALPGRRTAAQAAGTPVRGGTLNYLIAPEPSTLNCFNTTEGPAPGQHQGPGGAAEL